MSNLKSSKKILQKNVDLRAYQDELNLLTRFWLAGREYGNPVVSGVTPSGNPLLRQATAGELIKKYKLEKLLVILKQ